MGSTISEDVAHNHSHSHGHSHTPANYGTAFAIGVALNGLYVVGQTIFGLRANSMALLADAGHNLGDVVGLLAAWAAIRLAEKPPTPRRSYGLGSASILASLINAVLLLVTAGAIGWEAIVRFFHPEVVRSGTVVIVAGAGIVINGVTAWLFASGRGKDLNIRAAFVHMAADAGISVGVVFAALLIGVTGYLWIDPAMSLLIVAIVLWGTWSLLRESSTLALQAVPPGVDRDGIQRFLEGLPGVSEVHDLHIWALSTTETALTAHLVIPGANVEDSFLNGICRELHDQFEIEHTTIQVERGDPDHPCPLASDETI